MMQELDTIVLIHDIEHYGLHEGDIGVIIYCYESGESYEVEFVTADGNTIAVLTLTNVDIRPMHRKEILHVRELSVA